MLLFGKYFTTIWVIKVCNWRKVSIIFYGFFYETVNICYFAQVYVLKENLHTFKYEFMSTSGSILSSWIAKNSKITILSLNVRHLWYEESETTRHLHSVSRISRCVKVKYRKTWMGPEKPYVGVGFTSYRHTYKCIRRHDTTNSRFWTKIICPSSHFPRLS